MPKPPYLSDFLYGYDDGFSTIIISLIGSCISCPFVLLLSLFEFKFKNKIASVKFKQILQT